MRPAIKFGEGSKMMAHESVLFEKCPVCGQAEISMEKPSPFRFSKPRISPCPKCLAEFVGRGADTFQLVFCEPQRIVGKHCCRDRIFRGCYLDATLSKLEWQKIALGGESSEFTKFLEMNEKFRRGVLPIYPSAELLFSLKHGEIVHYISFPVYFDEQQPSKGKNPSDKGEFFLTNRRIVFVYPSGTFIIPLENVEQVEDSPPGFVVREKDSFEPRYFFPSSYDPIFAAVLGAIHNLKRKN